MKSLEYYSARNNAAHKVQRAKYEGRLPWLRDVWLPCVDCGARAVHWEHRDYDKPLKVEAVCQSCNFKRGPAHFTPRKEKPNEHAKQRRIEEAGKA